MCSRYLISLSISQCHFFGMPNANLLLKHQAQHLTSCACFFRALSTQHLELKSTPLYGAGVQLLLLLFDSCNPGSLLYSSSTIREQLLMPTLYFFSASDASIAKWLHMHSVEAGERSLPAILAYSDKVRLACAAVVAAKHTHRLSRPVRCNRT